MKRPFAEVGCAHRYDAEGICVDCNTDREIAECADCAQATGGICAKHQEPECTCYEVTGGHMQGCAFNRPR